MTYNPQDFYFKKAKKEGYLARSAFKLEEIQNKYRIIKRDSQILDLGCAPGSWSQFCLKILSGSGFLRGIDLTEVNLNAPNAEFVQADIFNCTLEEFKEKPYDVILSDMAPKTTGIVFTDQTRSEQLCEKVIELSDQLLKPNGHIVMKLFMGGGAKAIELELKKRFKNHHFVRPDSTRKQSKEIFLVGIGRK